MRARTSADLSIGDINLFIFGGLTALRDNSEETEGEHTLQSSQGTWNEMENTYVELQLDTVRKTYQLVFIGSLTI